MQASAHIVNLRRAHLVESILILRDVQRLTRMYSRSENYRPVSMHFYKPNIGSFLWVLSCLCSIRNRWYLGLRRLWKSGTQSDAFFSYNNAYQSFNYCEIVIGQTVPDDRIYIDLAIHAVSLSVKVIVLS